MLILLLHPIAALVVIREFVRQRNWRKLSISLKGSERAAELDNHEIQGERLFRWVLIVIALAFVAIFPYILMELMGINYDLASFFGGTSLLIIVGVALDTLQQIESHLMMRHYDGFLTKGKIRGRRRR